MPGDSAGHPSPTEHKIVSIKDGSLSRSDGALWNVQLHFHTIPSQRRYCGWCSRMIVADFGACFK